MPLSSGKSNTGLSTLRPLPRGIWVLGFVSLFMDLSTELIHSLLPVFMVSVLGASVVTLGIVEGVAEAAAAITKVFSGVISDYFQKRKYLLVFGYGLAALSKPFFPLATSIGWVFGARFVDRIGKGIRGAPRDALVADFTPSSLRGAAYGLRQALDTVGAFLGPLLAIVFMIWFADDIKAVLWIAVLPAMVSVLLLISALHEPSVAKSVADTPATLSLTQVKTLPGGYWLIVTLGAIFTLARFSEAFLILRAEDVGLALAYVPAVLIVMNVFYALLAYPAGALGDRLPARYLLVFGLLVLIVADVVLAVADSTTTVFVGAAIWGIHMAFTQGLLAKLVADFTPSELRGTGFGIFNLVSGGALLIASVIAGVLWNSYGSAATFFAGAVFSSIAAVGLLLAKAHEAI